MTDEQPDRIAALESALAVARQERDAVVTHLEAQVTACEQERNRLLDLLSDARTWIEPDISRGPAIPQWCRVTEQIDQILDQYAGVAQDKSTAVGKAEDVGTLSREAQGTEPERLTRPGATDETQPLAPITNQMKTRITPDGADELLLRDTGVSEALVRAGFNRDDPPEKCIKALADTLHEREAQLVKVGEIAETWRAGCERAEHEMSLRLTLDESVTLRQIAERYDRLIVALRALPRYPIAEGTLPLDGHAVFNGEIGTIDVIRATDLEKTMKP
jgi:hypothetical protein